jgi:hypothetical protein
VFYPQDLDRFSRTTTLSFRLSRPATVSWTIRNSGGAIVNTRYAAAPLAAGTYSWVFDGRSASGSMLPMGLYVATVVATDGTYTVSSSPKVEMGAFKVTPSATTAKRGSRVTVTAVTAEPITGSPQLYVSQPSLSTYVLRMSKVNSTTWRLTVTLKSGGTAGTLKLKVWAKDADGRSQATALSLTLK